MQEIYYKFFKLVVININIVKIKTSFLTYFLMALNSY